MSSLFLDYINAIDFEDVVEPYKSSLPRGYSITNYSKAKFYTPNDYKLSMSNLEDNAHFVSLEAPTDNEYYLRIDIKWYDNEGDIEKTAGSLETPIVPNAIFKGSYSTKLLDRPTMAVDHIVYKKGKEELYIKSWIFNQDNHLVICHVYTDYELGPQMIEVADMAETIVAHGGYQCIYSPWASKLIYRFRKAVETINKKVSGNYREEVEED
jgi:hypothetical protein